MRDHVVIVGGAGYIGTALVHRLMTRRRPTEVTVVDSLIFGGRHALHGFFPFSAEGDEFESGHKFTFVKQDVRDINVDDYGDEVGTVVNLAAFSLPLCNMYADVAMSINRDAAVRLARQCTERGIHYVFPSTCSNYGVRADEFAREEDVLKPTSVYAQSKVEAEYGMRALSHGDRITILRFATAYGLGGMFRPDLILHEFVRDAILKSKITLFGASFYRPVCHVDDIARAVVDVIQQQTVGGIFNIGNTQHNYTKMELASMVQQETGCEIAAGEGGLTDPRNYKVSFEKARKELMFNTIHEPQLEVKKLVKAYGQCALDFEAPRFGNNRKPREKENPAL